MFFLAVIGMGPTATPASAHGRAEGASPQPGYVQQGEITVRRKIIVRVPVHRQGDRQEHTSELQSLMRISYAVFCLKKKRPTQLHSLIPRTDAYPLHVNPRHNSTPNPRTAHRR